MVLHLAQDVAWMLVLGVLQCLHLRLWTEHRRAGQWASGLLFGGVCILGMMDPFNDMPGVALDGRSVVLGIAGLFGGPLVGGIAALLAGGYSLWLGHADMLAGLALAATCTTLGLLYRAAVARGWATLGALPLLAFGMLLQWIHLACLALLPEPIPAAQWTPMALSLVLIFTPATLLLGSVLQEGQRRDAIDLALRESEARFRSLLQDIPAVSVQAYAPDGTTRYWNKASEQLYGFSAEEALGRNLRDLIIPPDMREGVRQAMEQMFRTRQAIPAGELLLLHKDGSPVPVFSSHAYVQARGRPAEMFCIDIDLSARVRAEAELRIAATAFESREGMLVTDPQQVILRANRAFTQSMGYTDAEAVGQTLALLQAGPDSATSFQLLQQALRSQGQWAGEIWSRRKNGEEFPQWVTINAVHDEAGEVSHYIATLVDITQRKAAEEQIRQLAFFDPLTHLPNRRLLMDRLQRALAASERNKRTGALLFIDLDHFKTLNDTQGHEKGDLLLQQVAQRLQICVRDRDTVARLGGDEFLVVLEDLDAAPAHAAAHVKAVSEKIVAQLHQPYRLGNLDYNSTASVGIAMYSGQGTPAEELLKQADMAMYQAKAEGRDGLRFFDPAMQAVVNARAGLEADLRQGLALGQFLLHYQPQVDAQGRVTGAEALLRWPHPTRGMVPPVHFIPLAEETGHILPLGRWVLQTACAQLVAWAQDPVLGRLVLAVNVSARQFRDPDFASGVLALLHSSGANPRRLKLELTESMLADNLDDMVEKMAALGAHGIRFALDDFGTGYSSLSYLKRLPLDELKIDQSFVRDVLVDPSDAAIVRTVVGLAHNLGLEVLAEGVETEAQKDFLARCHCHVYQGYLFSRPVPVDAFEAFVRASVQPASIDEVKAA
ncbi:PAS domain S-box-containing protein/diguanylate cyclase (GGDEF) domain-containing protein [Rhodoferax sp. OV413]|uniref:EAL domain-containing protein n=1 Tax=Rhodoferax sp. OV413 TaxID=1855285 RepID=UPI0008836B37|nr:EAL domain-containing protein [Rhodoferax sp. OV413]SDP47405.1 PAS domain S-box-containing protein/diguanylate cyclase (GGDEF) domain-containing protein [Rhodoferax sp. OV413]